MNRSRLLLVLMACLLSMTSFGQEVQHMTFKGIPINGTLRELVPRMKQQGFTYEKVEQNDEGRWALFTGEFYGVKNCTIAAHAPDAVSNCQMIIVQFPSSNSWSLLENRYTKLKESLTSKYGPPAEVTEEFKGRTPMDDNAKMRFLLNGTCDYTSHWAIRGLQQGVITLIIAPDESNGTGCVLLNYSDVVNMYPEEESNDDDL